MDEDSLYIILANTEKWNDDTYSACVAALEKAQALPGMRNHPGESIRTENGRDVAEKLGETIKDMIWRYARREHGLTDGNRTLAGAIFSTALGHISDVELGAAFYPHVRERWCYLHDIDPYPR